MASGTIHNRDRFLANISGRLGTERKRSVEVPAWNHMPQWKVYENASQDELADIFAASSQAKSAAVIMATKAELPEAVRTAIAEYGGGQVVVSRDVRFTEYGMNPSQFGADVHVWDAELGQENIDKAKIANIGVFFGDMALAESGTVAQFNDKDAARSISLLPITYIAVIPKSAIVPRMTQLTAAVHQRVQKNQGIPACINLISGPSNSADIEMDIVIGVHGPVKAVHLIVTDA